MIFFEDAPSFQAVAAGSEATLNIPTRAGMRLRKLLITARNATLANGIYGGLDSIADQLEIRVAGQPVRRVSPTELAAIVDFNGQYTFGQTVGTNGAITAPKDNMIFQMPFTEEWRRTFQEEEFLAWGLSELASRNDDLQLIVKLKSGITVGELNALMEVDYATTVEGQPLGLGSIIHYDRHRIPISSAGEYDWPSLPRRGRLLRLHFFSSDVTRVEVEGDGRNLFEADLDQNNAALKQRGFNPSTGVFHVCFDPGQRLTQGIDLAKFASFRVKINTTGSPSPFNCVAEILAPVVI